MDELLKESGYLDDPAAVTEALLQDYFERDPDLLADWLGYAAGQGYTVAWFFKSPKEVGGPLWIVGQHGTRKLLGFKNGYEACARYTKRSVDSIR